MMSQAFFRSSLEPPLSHRIKLTHRNIFQMVYFPIGLAGTAKHSLRWDYKADMEMEDRKSKRAFGQAERQETTGWCNCAFVITIQTHPSIVEHFLNVLETLVALIVTLTSQASLY